MHDCDTLTPLLMFECVSLRVQDRHRWRTCVFVPPIRAATIPEQKMLRRKTPRL